MANLAKSLRMLGKVWRSQLGTLALPYKLNYIVTKECHSRCVNCRIWQVKPENELTIDEIHKFAKATPYLSWINFTGGEPTDRKDFTDVVSSFVRNCSDLNIVHFPTNGLKPEHIATTAEKITKLKIPNFYVTVSVDGPPEENDHLRGIPGDFQSALTTYKFLQSIKGVSAFIGMTLFPSNHTKIAETVVAIQKEIPNFSYRKFHANLAHISAHYYENSVIKKTTHLEMIQSLRQYRKERGWRRTPVDWIEERFMQLAEHYIQSGEPPIDCAALMASLFMTEKGQIYPCSIWNEPIGNIRETNYSLDPILNSTRAHELKQIIAKKKCARCWTPCEAFQSIAASPLAKPTKMIKTEKKLPDAA